MATSVTVSATDAMTAAQYNNLRTDVLTTHIHDGTDGNADLGGTVGMNILKLGTKNVKRKTADETVNNSTTLQNDDHLLGWTMDANGVYAVIGCLLVDSGATPDIKFQWTLPASAVGYTVVVDNGGSEQATHAAAGVITTAGAGTIQAVPISGVFIIAGTSGTATLQWAQNTADASDTKLRTGSWIAVIKLA